MKTPKAPKTLSKESCKHWKKINGEWALDDSALLILKVALEAYDRLTDARELIDKEGSTYATPTGQIKPHPALRIEKDARSGFLQAWKMLNLDVEIPGGIGRPIKS